MNDSMKQRATALENQYFQEQEKLALERLGSRPSSSVRTSPITGKPMKQITIAGVVVDLCEDSKGIFLDSGELEQIVAHSKQHDSWLSVFTNKILGK